MTASRLDFRDRSALFAAAEQPTFDLIVIGAGITGSGIARDAAMRGLSVALVEAADIASGTSSRSSKMIHGGLRYLAQGDINLVREAALERQTMRRIAPHLARPADFVMPTSKLMLKTMRAGLTAFERLGKVPKAERHQVLGLEGLATEEPLIDPSRYVGGVRYVEFLTNDARLTLANARSAAAAGATVLTHAPIERIVTEGGRAVAVVCRGALPGEDATCVLRGRRIVNAAGPWVDAVRALEAPEAPGRLALTKGIHIVVAHQRLPIRQTVITIGPDKRPIFAVPVHGATYLGTTDTFHPLAEAWPRIERTDVDYLLAGMARTFAGPAITHADVVAMWSGVRPLVAQSGKSPSEISRKDEMWVGSSGVITIAGGKLSAYRSMAERVVDTVIADLGVNADRCRTAEVPLVGGDTDVAAVAATLAPTLGEAGSTRLVDLYGSEAPGVAADGGDVEAEVRHAVEAEGVLRLEDYWVRRSERAWFSPEPTGPELDRAGAEIARLLGWSPERAAEEVARCRTIHTEAMSCLTRPPT